MNKPPPRRNRPQSAAVAPPTHLEANKNPTPQRNDPISSEAIFGVDVSVIAIEPQQRFAANFSKIVDLALITYHNMIPDVNQTDRRFIKEELVYYSVGLLWIRLLDIKSEQRLHRLTSMENVAYLVVAYPMT